MSNKSKRHLFAGACTVLVITLLSMFVLYPEAFVRIIVSLLCVAAVAVIYNIFYEIAREKFW